MKKTNLALAIFAAIAVAACGGSSSNDDAPVDKKPETVKPTTPTTGGNDSSKTPEKTPEEAKPETPAVAGGGAGSAGGKTDGKKEDKKDKKPETAGGGHGGKPVITTAEQAEKALKASSEKLNDLETQAREIKEQLDSLSQSLTDIDEQIQAKEKAKTAKTKETIEAEIAALKQQKAEKAAKLANVLNPIRKELEGLQAQVKDQKIVVANDKALHAKLADKPAVEVESLKLEAKALELAKEAGEKAEEARNAEKDFNKLNGQKQAKEAALTTAEKEAAEAGKGKDEEKLQKARERLAKVRKEKEDFDKALAAATTEKERTAKEAREASTKAEDTANEAEKLAEIAKTVGFSFSKDVAVNDAKAIDKVERTKEGNYVITLKGEEAFTVTLGGENAAQKIGNDETETYGKFGTVKTGEGDAAKTVSYAINTYESGDGDNKKYSGFGYIGGNFYHFGELTDLEEMKTLAASEDQAEGGIKYEGKAFVETIPAAPAEKDKEAAKPEMLVATVKATADFTGKNNKVNGLPSFSGTFEDFAPYFNSEGALITGSALEKRTGMDPVSFYADIKGNEFMTGQKQAESFARVKGQFYGKDAANFGGLVEHSSFHGSFGGGKKEAAAKQDE